MCRLQFDSMMNSFQGGDDTIIFCNNFFWTKSWHQDNTSYAEGPQRAHIGRHHRANLLRDRPTCTHQHDQHLLQACWRPPCVQPRASPNCTCPSASPSSPSACACTPHARMPRQPSSAYRPCSTPMSHACTPPVLMLPTCCPRAHPCPCHPCPRTSNPCCRNALPTTPF